MANIDKVYEDAVQSNLLPGVAVIAGDKNGKPLRYFTFVFLASNLIINSNRECCLLEIARQSEPGPRS